MDNVYEQYKSKVGLSWTDNPGKMFAYTLPQAQVKTTANWASELRRNIPSPEA